MTVSASKGQSDTAPALAKQGLRPILLTRKRLNPSRPCQEFRQGLSRISPLSGHSGRARAGRWWPSYRASRKSPLHGIPTAGAGPQSVQILSRICPFALDGVCYGSPLTMGPGQSRRLLGATVPVDHRLLPSSAGLVSPGDCGRACGRSSPPPDWQPSHHAPERPHHYAKPAPMRPNLSKIRQGSVRGTTSTLTASSTAKTSDARPQGLLLSACPVIRQSVVKEAYGTVSSVRRRRPPASPARPGVRP